MPIDARLLQLGYRSAVRPAGKRRLFITTEGPTATGKTEFIRTCRPPIVVLDFDRGMEGVAEYDIWGNEIAKITLELPDLDEFSKTASPGERQIAKESYARFKKLVEQTLKSGAVGTLCVDTGTAAYTLAQVARFGQIAQLGEVPPAMWTSMQGEFERIFLQYEDYPVNLVVSHRQGEKFMGVKGEKELKGYKQMQHLAQVHLAFEKRWVRDDKQQIVKRPNGLPMFEFVRRAVKCRQRIAVEGTEFPVVFLDDEMTESVGGDFLTIAQAVFPGTTEADWI